MINRQNPKNRAFSGALQASAVRPGSDRFSSISRRIRNPCQIAGLPMRKGCGEPSDKIDEEKRAFGADLEGNGRDRSNG